MLNARKGKFAMDKPFPGLPPLKPAGALKRPETLTTVLPNGLRVASQETYGALCSCGIIIDAGRYVISLHIAAKARRRPLAGDIL